MSSTNLRLYPANPALAPDDTAHFVAALQAVGLLDPVVAYAGSVPYSPGPRFYELITFQTSYMVMKLRVVGNQVQELGLVDSRELCRIAISEVSPEQEFLGMGNTRPPRCPVCGREVSEWQHIMDLWFENKINYR